MKTEKYKKTNIRNYKTHEMHDISTRERGKTKKAT